MRIPRTGVLLAVLCAASLPTARGQALEEGFAPLRYGDPDDLAYTQPFFPETPYDAAVPRPEDVLGQDLGTRLSHPAEIVACFESWAAASPRVTVTTYGHTHEGRPLLYAVLTTPENHARLDEIRSRLGALADPRTLRVEELEHILDVTPPVAWMGYSIHGDELSGCDAALALGYHLAAGQSEEVQRLLQQVVVVIDPCLNPDGRERIVTQVEQGHGRVVNLDYSSMQRGRWPWGRGNHYLFDMNRDWMVGSQPETRGRWRAIRSFHPQLLVDAHEMGSLDTYLFYPQADPKNPFLPPSVLKWQEAFGNEQAQAFDDHGWGYYTREWADAWAPFYSDAWGSLNGAIGILYEQASTAGFPLRRESGEILTYRESVHHHVVSSWSNLNTLARHSREILTDYAAERRRSISRDTPGNDRALAVRTGRNAGRERHFLELLLAQGIEVYGTEGPVTVQDAVSSLGAGQDSVELPAGTWIVPARQPQGALVNALLQFEIRLDRDALQREREELERKGASTMYDDTSWSLPLAFDLDALWCRAPETPGALLTAAPAPRGDIPPAAGTEEPLYGWAVDGGDDASLRFAVQALEQGLAVHVADRAFHAAGRAFPAGSFLVRAHENEDGAAAKVAAAAGRSGVPVFPLSTGRGPGESPDLGGGHFHLMVRPRVALLGNAPFAPDAYGHLWHFLDVELGVPVSTLDAAFLESIDLRRYNVLVVPPAFGSVQGVLGGMKETLATWVEAGGTLIACGNAADALTQSRLALTSVALRDAVLETLEEYEFAAQKDREARRVSVDETAVWDGADAEDAGEGEEEEPAANGAALAAAEESWRERFAPRGVYLRTFADPEFWLTLGSPAEMPWYTGGASVLLCKAPVHCAVRYGESAGLRLSGLLWPEARARLAESAAVTVESRGNGQVILFATTPAYRATVRSSARIFGNAVVLGPGVGASAASGW